MAKVILSDTLTANGQKRVKIFTDTDTDKFYMQDDNGDVTEISGPTVGLTDDVVIDGATFSFVNGLLISITE
jgi:hypothetical protein